MQGFRAPFYSWENWGFGGAQELTHVHPARDPELKPSSSDSQAWFLSTRIHCPLQISGSDAMGVGDKKCYRLDRHLCVRVILGKSGSFSESQFLSLKRNWWCQSCQPHWVVKCLWKSSVDWVTDNTSRIGHWTMPKSKMVLMSRTSLCFETLWRRWAPGHSLCPHPILSLALSLP